MKAKKVGPPLQVAAALPGEYQFLSAIVSDPADEAARLVYADWLEERGDARSAFVRELAAAARSLGGGARLPDPAPHPRAWTNMLGYPLFEGIAEFGLLDVKDAVLRLARPIVTITTGHVKEGQLAVGGSKFGGRPDLPPGADWPTCAEGPLGFLGQVALADLKDTHAARGLPKDGLLSFFAYQSFDTGYQPGQGMAGDTRILYVPASEPLRRREPPEDIDEEANGVLPSCRLALCETWDLPAARDELTGREASDLEGFRRDDLDDKLHDLRRKCHPFGHHLMGYSVHFRTDDPTPGADWAHLLCLDSDDNLGWSWCDGEHLAVYVHGDDLRAGTFARVFGYAS